MTKKNYYEATQFPYVPVATIGLTLMFQKSADGFIAELFNQKFTVEKLLSTPERKDNVSCLVMFAVKLNSISIPDILDYSEKRSEIEKELANKINLLFKDHIINSGMKYYSMSLICGSIVAAINGNIYLKENNE